MTALRLTEALQAWTEALDSAHVLTAHDVLTSAATATFETTSRVLAILRPGDLDEVRAVVRIANRYAVPLYPVSSGRNWGYGSRVPPRDGVIVDLSRLNRIVEYDEDLAYVTVEPGVTQAQLYAFLQARGGRLWMDATGASPECSIVGNTLERGFGHTPMGDHCANACGLQVVLPNGDLIETGFGRFAGARTVPVSRWGTGPSLDGLFSQSSFGIVTRMTVWLMPAPEAFEAFFFLSRDESSLPAIVDALRPLRLNGTLRSVMHVVNDYKVITGAAQFPWDRAQGVLDPPTMAAIRGELGIGAWNGSGGLYGTKAQVREARRQVRRALRGKVDRLQFVDDRLIALMSRFAGPFRFIAGWDVKKTLNVLEPAYNLLKGVPTKVTLASAYWRKRMPPPADMDPDRDGCGLLWCSPVLPNTGRHAAEVAALAQRVILEHRFEPQMSLSLTSERSAICVITISYDREIAGEDQRALACYRDLTARLLERGYPPYRLSLASMHHADADRSYSRAVQSLKDALDPNRVLAPGRYEGDRSARAAHGDLASISVVRSR